MNKINYRIYYITGNIANFVIIYNNYKWSITFKICESIYCIPETYNTVPQLYLNNNNNKYSLRGYYTICIVRYTWWRYPMGWSLAWWRAKWGKVVFSKSMKKFQLKCLFFREDTPNTLDWALSPDMLISTLSPSRFHLQHLSQT